MTSFVHLIEGDCPTARLARIAKLAEASRLPPVILAETGEPPCRALDWLMGPACACCLPEAHPRRHLLRAASGSSPKRILIDAGPPAVTDRIIALLRALPVPMHLNVLGS